jgi:hypothetical protein
VSDETFPGKAEAKADVDKGDLEWFRFFVSKRRWQQGKADPSHEYTIREWVPDDESGFERAVVFIRELGEPAKYFSETYVYLHVDGMKYWTMGSPIGETTVVNRAAS